MFGQRVFFSRKHDRKIGKIQDIFSQVGGNISLKKGYIESNTTFSFKSYVGNAKISRRHDFSVEHPECTSSCGVSCELE